MPFAIETAIPPTVWSVGQTFEFQLNMAEDSTPDPTAWSATGLPSGVTIDNSGLITGAAEEPGVFDIVAEATDGGANTDEVAFQIGITDRMDLVSLLGGAVEVDVEARTGFVTVVNTEPGAGENDGERGAILYAKRGDTIQLAVGMPKDGVLQDVDMVAAVATLKAKETDPNPLVASDGLFYKTGTFEAARWILDVYVDPDKVDAALAEEEDEEGTFVPVLCEIQLTWNWWPPGTDPNANPAPTPRVINRTSQTFKFMVERDWTSDPS